MGVPGKILIVDDEPEALENCRRILSRLRYECLVERDPLRALSVIEREQPGLVLTDLCMPGLDGIGVLTAAKQLDPRVQVVLMTGYATVETAVTSMRRGAMDYLLKPFTGVDLEAVVRRAFAGGEDARGAGTARSSSARAGTAGILGRSPALREVLALVEKVARRDANVLIYGESGTGKELVARAIHRQSRRAARPFVPVDCAALSDSLLESELFGHERGAFTGAYVARSGLFEVADGGTVFLDEVGGMSPSLQSRLLRVLQERQVRRVGGVQYLDVDVRVIAASNRDLEAACAKGEFREDLYYRLNVVPITLPPLRARAGDVELLARAFLRRLVGGPEDTEAAGPDFDPDALALLTGYHWPGNVRELQNVVERAAALADGPTIRPEHLPPALRRPTPPGTPSADGATYKHVKRQVMQSFERGFLLDLLRRNGWHMGRSAREAGVDRKTIERMVKKHGLRPEAPPPHGA